MTTLASNRFGVAELAGSDKHRISAVESSLQALLLRRVIHARTSARATTPQRKLSLDPRQSVDYQDVRQIT